LTPLPGVYIPAAQAADDLMTIAHTWFSPAFVVRTGPGARGLEAGIGEAVAAADPLLPVSGFRQMSEVRGEALDSERLLMALLAGLAGLAVILAAIGLYGLIASTVQERTRELGIRMALGATAGQAVRSAVAPGMVLTATGVVLGLGLAWAGSTIVKSMVWGVKPSDLPTRAGVVILMMAVAAAASAVPAWRILRLDPARTLRHE